MIGMLIETAINLSLLLSFNCRTGRRCLQPDLDESRLYTVVSLLEGEQATGLDTTECVINLCQPALVEHSQRPVG